MREHEIRSGSVYLSLGEREEKTRNRVMSTVGEKIREVHELLCRRGVTCTLEWNPGNHFRDPGLRTAKAFAWLIRNGYCLNSADRSEAELPAMRELQAIERQDLSEIMDQRKIEGDAAPC